MPSNFTRKEGKCTQNGAALSRKIAFEQSKIRPWNRKFCTHIATKTTARKWIVGASLFANLQQWMFRRRRREEGEMEATNEDWTNLSGERRTIVCLSSISMLSRCSNRLEIMRNQERQFSGGASLRFFHAALKDIWCARILWRNFWRRRANMQSSPCSLASLTSQRQCEIERDRRSRMCTHSRLSRNFRPWKILRG